MEAKQICPVDQGYKGIYFSLFFPPPFFFARVVKVDFGSSNESPIENQLGLVNTRFLKIWKNQDFDWIIIYGPGFDYGALPYEQPWLQDWHYIIITMKTYTAIDWF